MEVTFGRFVAALRNADVRVSPAETLVAFAVVERVGIADQVLLKDALALTLAKSRDEKERFDETFERFFFQLAFRQPAKRTLLRRVDRQAVLDELTNSLSADLLQAVAHVLDDDLTPLTLRVQQAAEEAGLHEIRHLRDKPLYAERIERALALDELDAHVEAHAGGGSGEGGALLRYLRQYFRQQVRSYVDDQYRLHVDASGQQALIEAALKSNLDQLPLAYHQEVRRVVERIAARLASEHRLRRKHARRGALDIKKTLRRNVAYDGAVFELAWRRRKREPATVFVLCDVSNSVARVARFLLLFLYQLADVLPDVRAFAFSSRLGEITDVMRDNATDAAIEETLFRWGKGNTDYGRAFFDFRELVGGDLHQRSTLIVVGDARNNHYAPQHKLFAELSRRVKQTYWLNPERRETWHEGDSEMRRYAPHCFKVETCNKLRDLERFAEQLLASAG